MGGTVMEFLNRLGLNSKPNGFPLIFGKSIEVINRELVGLPTLTEDWNYFVICREYLDKYDHYLNQFKAEGYKTMVAHDYDPGIIFYPNCSGIKRAEADHMWRPFDIRIKKSKKLRDSMERSCTERHLEMLDYMEKFSKSYPGVPKIGQMWLTSLAHDSPLNLYHADDQFLMFFKNNKKNLENAFVFLMGDHGPRTDETEKFTYYEFNNPFLLVTIPRIYHNTGIHEQMKSKSHQLMTNFDLHATLLDILKLQPNFNFTDSTYREMWPLSKGSSLMREWRGVRNCRTLPISSEYCLCQYNKTKINDTDIHKRLGKFLEKTLNELLHIEGLTDKCRLQEYYSTSEVWRYEDVGDTIYYTAVYLRPSNGLFSTFIRYTTNGLQMVSGLTRKDLDARQEDCIKGNRLAPICHCYNTV